MRCLSIRMEFVIKIAARRAIIEHNSVILIADDDCMVLFAVGAAAIRVQYTVTETGR